MQRCLTSSSFHTGLWVPEHPNIHISQQLRNCCFSLPSSHLVFLFSSSQGHTLGSALPAPFVSRWPPWGSQFHLLGTHLLLIALFSHYTCLPKLPQFYFSFAFPFIFCVPQLQSKHFHHKFAPLVSHANLLPSQISFQMLGYHPCSHHRPFLLTAGSRWDHAVRSSWKWGLKLNRPSESSTSCTKSLRCFWLLRNAVSWHEHSL